MRATRTLALAAGLGLALTAAMPAGRAADDQESFRSLHITAADALVLAADPRLHMGAEGTVELWLAVAEQQDVVQPSEGERGLCIAQHGDEESGLVWRLSLSPDANGLIFTSERATTDLRQHVRLAGGDYVHVALATVGGRTQLILDGRHVTELDRDGLPQPGVEVDYLPAVPEGRPLTLGCEGAGPPAQVWISSFRLWDRALSAGDLRWSMGFTGWPEGRPDLSRHLMLYSLFTDQRQDLLYTRAPIQFTPFAGGVQGTTFFHRRPGDQEITGLHVLPGRGFGIRDLIVEYDAPTRGFGLEREPLEQLTLPTVMPSRSSDPVLGQAAVLRSQMEDLRRLDAETPGLAASDPELRRLVDLFVTARARGRELALGFEDQDGDSTAGETANGLVYDSRLISLTEDDRLVRISGVHTGTHLANLRFETQFFHEGILGHVYHGGEIFNFTLPPGARIEGIAGRRDGELISALALAYSVPPHPEHDTVPARLARGIWIDRNAPAPRRDVTIPRTGQDGAPFAAPAEFHGTYGDQKVYRFTYRPADGRLTIYIIDPRQAVAESRMFFHSQGMIWNELGGRQGQLFVTEDQIHWIGADRVYEQTLVRPSPYPPPHADKLPWGATFSLEQRPAGIEANFLGYLPYRMRARDYQATTGVDKRLFAMPADDSTDFLTTGSHVIVPHGLLFRRDIKGSERTRSWTTRTAQERQSAWSLSIGAKVGVTGLFSFGEDWEYQESQDAMHANGLGSILNRAIATHYAMVMDLARIRLADAFQARILEFRDRLLVEEAIDWPDFFRTFGTHYPYAVTYGGMAWMETESEQEEFAAGSSMELKLKAEAEGTFEGIFQIGGKVGGSYSEASRTSGERSAEDSVFGTYGGSFSRGGGWSLAHGEEVPLLLDLRPIYELLNPVFFDDPLIFDDLRAQMMAGFKVYEIEVVKELKTTTQWADAIRLDFEDDRP